MLRNPMCTTARAAYTRSRLLCCRVLLRAMATEARRARIAVCGAGWWAQGWHLPHLSRNARARIVAIVEPQANPYSPITPLQSLEDLGVRYSVPTFCSIDDLLAADVELDGLLVCTSHASHFEVGMKGLGAGLHIMMEKPMTTDVDEARKLAAAAAESGLQLMVNNTANWRCQTVAAAEMVHSGSIGEVQHVACSMHSPLLWLFDDPVNKSWTKPSGSMAGNGFGWGQLPHLLAWVLKVCALEPTSAYAVMNNSEKSGADMLDAAVIKCGRASIAVSGSACVPGNAHEESGGDAHSVGKHISLRVFGSRGMISYEGDDQQPQSGALEMRGRDGTHTRRDGFYFENYESDGDGPESLHAFVSACLGEKPFVGADYDVGLRTVLAIDAMYRSAKSGQVENVL